MNNLNARNLVIESDVIVNNEFKLVHTRLIHLHGDENADVHFTIKSKEELEFDLAVNFVFDYNNPGPDIKYTSDPVTGKMIINFINLSSMTIGSNETSTKRTHIANIDNMELYMDFSLHILESNLDYRLLYINLYTKNK